MQNMGGIIYPCKYCEKTLVSMEGLRRHQLYYHSEKYDENARLLYCDQCEYQSIGKYQLKRHIQSVHSKEENSDQCPYCEYTWKSLTASVRHILDQTGCIAQKLCDIFNYKFVL